MTAPQTDAERLAEALVGVTPGPWDVYAEPISDTYDAVAELTYQIVHTKPLASHLYMLNANGKCPAVTGCGPTSEANARFIALCREAVPALLEAHAAREREVVRLREALEAVINIPAVKRVLGTKHTAGCDCPMCKARALLTGASHA